MVAEKSSKKKAEIRTSIDGKVLPNSFEAEQAVLGCAMLDSDAVISIVSKLEEMDFYNPTHRYIFAAIRKLQNKLKPIDFITVSGELEEEGNIASVGGMAYVQSLTNVVPSSANFSHYVEIVKKQSLLRQLISLSGEIIEDAYNAGDNENLVGIAEKKIYELAEKGQRSSLEKIAIPVAKVMDNFEKIARNGGKSDGLKTGFYQLDKNINGLQKSDLIILAARPGVGKTSFAMNIVSNAAIYSKAKCAIFSFEMSAELLARRMICSVANVSMSKGMRGEYTSAEWAKLMQAKTKLDEAAIYIDDNSMNTPSQVLSKCRKLKREQGLDLVVIDYIGLMKADEKSESRQVEVSNISRQLKILAKEIDVPVIALSQLNRAVETREDGKPGRPNLSDLRDSGQIEQDADMVWFIHRDMTKNDFEKDPNQNYTAELIIAKFRNGQTGSVFLGWDGSRTSFVNLERDAEEQSIANVYESQEQNRRMNKLKSESDFKSALNEIKAEFSNDAKNGNFEEDATNFEEANFQEDIPYGEPPAEMPQEPTPKEDAQVKDFSDVSVDSDDVLFD